MPDRVIQTVPNQRTITVNKSPTDKKHLYANINLSAIDEASGSLLSAGGFKLYIYLAKNQNKYTFALSSKDFCAWSGLGITAYNTAFKELVAAGYLVQSDTDKHHFSFYDKSLQSIENNEIIIDYPRAKEQEETGFVF